MARGHGRGRVRRARAGGGLAVVRRLAGDGADADGVAGELEGAGPLEVELAGGLLLGREVEDEVADLALGLGDGQVEVEDGADVLGGHLRPLGGREGVVGLALGDGHEQAGAHEGLAEAAVGLDGVGRARLLGGDLVGLGGGGCGEGEGQGAGDGGDLHLGDWRGLVGKLERVAEELKRGQRRSELGWIGVDT